MVKSRLMDEIAQNSKPAAGKSHGPCAPNLWQCWGNNGWLRIHPITTSYSLSTAGKGDPMAKTMKIGRDAGTGQFKPVKEAQKDPKHTVVETIKRPTKK